MTQLCWGAGRARRRSHGSTNLSAEKAFRLRISAGQWALKRPQSGQSDPLVWNHLALLAIMRVQGSLGRALRDVLFLGLEPF
jgi:hypothetical protein